MHAFPRRLCVFSRGLGCRARRGAACTPRRKTGSRAGSATRALSVQSREIWQVITGSFSVELRRAEQDNGKPACQLFCSTAVKGSNNRLKLSSGLQLRTLLCLCGPTMLCVVMMYACVLCACVRVYPCVTHGTRSTRLSCICLLYTSDAADE